MKYGTLWLVASLIWAFAIGCATWPVKKVVVEFKAAADAGVDSAKPPK